MSIPKSKKELANYYGISGKTLAKWLEKIPNLEITKEDRLLTPNQVRLIIEHLGEP